MLCNGKVAEPQGADIVDTGLVFLDLLELDLQPIRDITLRNRQIPAGELDSLFSQPARLP